MFEEMSYRAGEWNQLDVVMGMITVLLCLEVTRRGAGWFLGITTTCFVAYAYLGATCPGY